ncbi:MAG: M60 family metallopeptidase [Phycisphaerales bacterium]|jgi:hypothetical protein
MNHAHFCIRVASLCFAACLSAAQLRGVAVAANAQPVAAAAAPADALLRGVDAIPPVGSVGEVALWGQEAFAVVVGKEGDGRLPIIGAGPLGKGRVMAWAHDYGTAAAAAKLSTGQLLQNACTWAAGPRTGKVRVALLGSDLADYLTAHGFEAARIKDAKGSTPLADSLAHADVLLCTNADLSDVNIAAIDRFVRDGGGFICFACPWGWAQVHHRPVSDIPFNRILAPAGVALADGIADPTKDGTFDATAVPGPEFNASHALDILEAAPKAHANTPDAALVKQAGLTATSAVPALPASDQLLRPRLQAFLQANANDLAPTAKHPLKDTQALDRVLLSLQVSELDALKPADVRAHAAAADFPGAVPPDAPRITRAVSIDTSIPQWHSTGLYAPAGEVITLTVPDPASGLRVRIGCHTDELWHMPQWKRVPRISREWPLSAAAVQVASPFGGLVYIDVPERSTKSPTTLSVTIAGAVEAPLFVLHQTTNADWTTRVRNLPGPWAELACDRVILAIPTSVARTIDDPTAIMEHWVRVLDADADLAGLPHERPCPQRYAADVQISAGYMHSGYPIMTHLDAATFMTSSKGLVDSGWGPYHEMGHNHQQDAWTFDGTGEVTCNIFTLYVLENVCGVADASHQKVFSDEATRARAKYFAEGHQFAKWKSDPFLALQMYAQLRLAFGWDVYKHVFAQYRDQPASDRPTTEADKRDQWLTHMSRATGKNLGPFFEAWGVPTTQAARDALADLPAWMPDEMNGQ